MNEEIAEELNKWSAATPIRNHWRHDECELSIRVTPPTKRPHISPTGGWVVEAYPVDKWPILKQEADGIRRWTPSSEKITKRLVTALMLSVAEHDAYES